MYSAAKVQFSPTSLYCSLRKCHRRSA